MSLNRPILTRQGCDRKVQNSGGQHGDEAEQQWQDGAERGGRTVTGQRRTEQDRVAQSGTDSTGQDSSAGQHRTGPYRAQLGHAGQPCSGGMTAQDRAVQ